MDNFLTRSNCYSCLRMIGTQPETCQYCGWHRKTVHRADGKRGLSNSPETTTRVRRNLVKTAQHVYVPAKPVHTQIVQLCLNSPTYEIKARQEHSKLPGITHAANTLGFNPNSLVRIMKAETVTACTAFRVLGSTLFIQRYGDIPVCKHGRKVRNQKPITSYNDFSAKAGRAPACACDKPIPISDLDHLTSCLKCGLELR